MEQVEFLVASLMRHSCPLNKSNLHCKHEMALKVDLIYICGCLEEMQSIALNINQYSSLIVQVSSTLELVLLCIWDVCSFLIL